MDQHLIIQEQTQERGEAAETPDVDSKGERSGDGDPAAASSADQRFNFDELADTIASLFDEFDIDFRPSADPRDRKRHLEVYSEDIVNGLAIHNLEALKENAAELVRDFVRDRTLAYESRDRRLAKSKWPRCLKQDSSRWPDGFETPIRIGPETQPEDKYDRHADYDDTDFERRLEEAERKARLTSSQP